MGDPTWNTAGPQMFSLSVISYHLGEKLEELNSYISGKSGFVICCLT